MIPLIVGVTSHRNIPAREVESIRLRVRDFFARLQREFPHSALVVLSALAEGGDQIAAQEALAVGAQVIAPLPLPRDLYAQDFTHAAARAAFDALCGRAHLIEMPLLPGHTLEEVALAGVERDRQYARAGVFIARHCHLLLTIWDGKQSDRLGGTAQVVDYYLHGIMPGLIERRRGARRWLFGYGDERPVCHLVCSRDGADGAPPAPLQAGQILWRTAGSVSAPDVPMPARFRNAFAEAGEFNADAAKYQAQIDASPADPVERGAPPALATLFRAADWLAMHFQRRVLLAMRISYSVAGLMGIAFAVYDNLTNADAYIYVFLLLFASGVIISTIAARREWHRKYLDYRALAEGLRVQGYWRRAGISLTGDPEFAQDSLQQKQDIALDWVRNAMRSADLIRAPDAPDRRAEQLHAVIGEWIGNADSGQLAYYTHKAGQRERNYRMTEHIGRVSLYAGIAISIVLAALAFRLSVDAKNDLIVLMAVFSVSGAVREAYAYRKADKELIKQYRFMRRLFTDARTALQGARDDGERREILRALGEAALAEHAEWAMMHRQRPLEHGRM
ncbi:MAG: hypothetical protein JSS13_07730 [Proteobacteria bacterium]|jgi:hypothetical protein|nr:hypothetical protein [Pseudomonadota bacterium]